jgi:hypothetical protein
MTLAIAGAACCRAAEWSSEAVIGVRSEYNTNYLLTAFPHEPLYGWWVSPGVKFAGATERLEFAAKAAGEFVRYRDGQETGFTNLYFPLSARYRTERDVFGLDLGFTRDSTLMGELQQTGVVLDFTQRSLWNFHPAWSRSLSERLSLQADYQASDASYDNGLQLGLFDYRMRTFNVEASYELTRRDRLRVSGVRADFDAPDAGRNSKVGGVQLSISHDFSETLSSALSAGPRWVSIDLAGASVPERQMLGVYSGVLKKTYERLRLQLEAKREIQPSGLGFLLRTDRIAAVIENQFTETLAASVSGSQYTAQGVGTTSFERTRYLTVGPRLSWRLAERWMLEASYAYARREVETLSQEARSDSVYLTISYSPRKFSLAR